MCFRMWTDEYKSKTLVWLRLFCFALVKTKTDIFKNALVWSGLKIYTALLLSSQMGFWSCPLGASDSWYVEKSGLCFGWKYQMQLYQLEIKNMR